MQAYPREGAKPLADAYARRYEGYPCNLINFDKVQKLGKTVFKGPEGEYRKGEELLIDEDHTSGGRNKKLIHATAIAAGLAVPVILTDVDRQ